MDAPLASMDELPPECAVIEVRVRELSQLFDSMDPSPFHEKDLDPDAEEYIVSSARELPGKQPIALVVHLVDPRAQQDVAELLRAAMHVHFERRALLTRRQLSLLLQRGWISLAIGLAVLAAAIVGGRLLAQRIEAPFGSLLRESLMIGGWVAMWRPMEILLYDWWPVIQERRIYERLSRALVQVVDPDARKRLSRAAP